MIDFMNCYTIELSVCGSFMGLKNNRNSILVKFLQLIMKIYYLHISKKIDIWFNSKFVVETDTGLNQLIVENLRLIKNWLQVYDIFSTTLDYYVCIV